MHVCDHDIKSYKSGKICFLLSFSSIYSRKKKCDRPYGFFGQLNYLFIVILTKLNFLKLLKLYSDTFKFTEKNICAYQISPKYKDLCQQYPKNITKKIILKKYQRRK